MENKCSVYLTLSLCVFLLFLSIKMSTSCNEAICASIVSKCLLLEACNCSMADCSCCKTCSNCLSYLYSECCSCVELCPKQEGGGSGNLSRQSLIRDLEGNLPTLFAALTSEPDLLERWTPFTFPVDYPFYFSPRFDKEFKYKSSVEQEVAPGKDMITLNCSVAFLSGCITWETCEDSCRSMGASKYRWFHDGCCQCVGEYCNTYGINESRCLKCPRQKGVSGEDYGDEDLDYGEE